MIEMAQTLCGVPLWVSYLKVGCNDLAKAMKALDGKIIPPRLDRYNHMNLRFPSVPATFASHGRDHRLTASGFFPCSIDREYLYSYAADGHRSPLWLCAPHNRHPVLVHRQRGTKVFFHQALQDRKLLAIPGPLFRCSSTTSSPATGSRAPTASSSNITGSEGAGDTVEERDATDAETDAEFFRPTPSWLPPGRLTRSIACCKLGRIVN